MDLPIAPCSKQINPKAQSINPIISMNDGAMDEDQKPSFPVESTVIVSPSVECVNSNHAASYYLPAVAAAVSASSIPESDIGLVAVVSSPSNSLVLLEDDDDDDLAKAHVECCLICGGIGELLMCDTCPFVYHLRCVHLRKVPQGMWSCDVCLGKATVDAYREDRMRRRQQDRDRERMRARSGMDRMTRSGRMAAQQNEEMSQSDSDGEESQHLASLEDDYSRECDFCHKREVKRNTGYEALQPHDPYFAGQRFVGPFFETQRETREIWVHKACALWSPRVYTEGGELVNVLSEVQRARWLNCAWCGKRGASIGCCDPDCNKCFHYPCAIDAQCLMEFTSYLTFCSDHAVAKNLTHTIQLPSALLDIRLKNSQACIDGANDGGSHSGVILGNRRRNDDGYYQCADIFEEYLNSVKHIRAKKDARFAHLAHLPYPERKRRMKLEMRVLSVQEMDAIKEKEQKKVEKRKRELLLTTEPGLPAYQVGEEPPQRKQKHEEDRHTLEEMNAVPSASGITSSATTAAAALPTPTGWSMVGGLETQIASIKECVILPLLYPEVFTQLHIRAPKGIVLVGPPGTGKTLLARALSQACSIPGYRPITFFARKGADVLSKFHGEAELTLRMLFEKAKRQAPSIIYFDEIDGLAPVRSAKQNQVHASVVTTLLTLMDGLSDSGEVFVLASTNRIDAIDPALRRPGRFDREVFVGLPNIQQRRQILRIQTQSWPKDSQLNETDEETVARRAVGFSGADLKSLAGEAALAAAHRSLGNKLMQHSAPPPQFQSFSLTAEAVSSTPAVAAKLVRNPAVLASIPFVTVSLCDFEVALAKLQSSIRRHNTRSFLLPPTETVSDTMRATTELKLREVFNVLDLPESPFALSQAQQSSFNAELELPSFMEADGPISNPLHLSSIPTASSLTPPSVNLRRLLICGNDKAYACRFSQAGEALDQLSLLSPINPSLLVTSLLSQLDVENLMVHRLDLPALSLIDNTLSTAEACIRVFQEALSTTTNIFYLPRFDEWWSQTSAPSLQPVRGAMIACLRNLSMTPRPSSSSATNIFLATSGCDRTSLFNLDGLHPFFKELFSADCCVNFQLPSKISCKRFFTGLMQQTFLRKLGSFLAQMLHAEFTARAQRLDLAYLQEGPAKGEGTETVPSLKVIEDCMRECFYCEKAVTTMEAVVGSLVDTSLKQRLTFLDFQALERWMELHVVNASKQIRRIRAQGSELQEIDASVPILSEIMSTVSQRLLVPEQQAFSTSSTEHMLSASSPILQDAVVSLVQGVAERLRNRVSREMDGMNARN